MAEPTLNSIPTNPRDVVDRVLEEMEQRLGKISAEVLVKEAESPKHPLHDRFVWDDEEAARRWRLQQAQNIIRASKFVTYIKQDGALTAPIRKYISFPTNEHEYGSREKVMKIFDVRVAFIGRKLAELQTWCNETIDVPELSKIRKEILDCLARFKM